MKRPDYRALQALDAVIKERGFERAADKLCITQPAVSQRIKQLESFFGQQLLVRTIPPKATKQGEHLLGLLHQVELLEQQWLGDNDHTTTPLSLSIAVNADSLATWLLPALKPVLDKNNLRFDIQVKDEEHTLDLLRLGTVVGAISIQELPLPGCLSDRLGALDYIFVASPDFAKRYFPNGVTRSTLMKAPAVAFDHLDDMHQMFLNENFNMAPGSVICHITSSSEAFVQLAKQGAACCMLPILQVENELKNGELINLTEGLFQRRMLYWHRFGPESSVMQNISETLTQYAKNVLWQQD
ncbi:LysR family transcriptional regulator ArgP [Frischella sp. Ac48]|uniref:HTH-type transcriptional regulator ArgP n=1 Tax=Frischella japonica TaxID=2741544 RepID=A0ABR7R0T2_9GAMM|nr:MULTISPECIES: LysR family transcriptional regulator ArgP [Frischella]MBC9131868.1 LysR family transcriptional regulator ArgP [Frischella japonica]MBX4132605.1 LysR family transcriptional regulator ArgP [Frischella sp. Ac48]